MRIDIYIGIGVFSLISSTKHQLIGFTIDPVAVT